MNLESMNETLAPKKHGRLAFFWMILGALAMLTVFPYLLAINPSALIHRDSRLAGLVDDRKEH